MHVPYTATDWAGVWSASAHLFVDDQPEFVYHDVERGRFGLSAAVFTQDIDKAIRFAREVDSGNLHINFGTAWRAETMPYGGLKDSGMGKEGPKYAIEEMTETKMVVIH